MTDLVFPAAAPDLAAEARRWLAHLTGERQVAAHTLDAYARDLRQFLAFLAEHFGEKPALATISALKTLDIRAFMAMRRAEGAGNRSLLRQLAGVRSFARHLEREGKGKAVVFSSVRAPKLARSLPKALAPMVTQTAGGELGPARQFQVRVEGKPFAVEVAEFAAPATGKRRERGRHAGFDFSNPRRGG